MATKKKFLCPRLFSPQRYRLLVLPIFLAAAASLAWGQADNLRLQRVVKSFVAETGHEIAGVGSWISGVGYISGQSDQTTTCDC